MKTYKKMNENSTLISKSTRFPKLFETPMAKAVFLFALGLMIAYFPFVLKDVTFIWSSDGLYQHCTFLGYILENNGVSIGDFDLNIGLGGDYLFSFAYYFLLDPLNIISIILKYVFCISDIVIIYNVSVVVRLSLVYFVMLFYLKHKGVSPVIASVGALCYMLCGTTLFSVVRHPMFSTGLIYLPLIIWGAENIFENKRPYLIIISAFLASLSNYYQFILISFFLVIYCIIYYFQKFPTSKCKFSFKNFIIQVLKIGGSYLLGILLSAFLLLPVGYGMLTSARGSSKGISFPNLKNYWRVLCQYFYVSYSVNYASIGLNFIISVLAIYRVCKTKDAYSIGLVVLVALSFSRLFGWIMNIFNYYAGRWLFAMSFYCTMIGCLEFDNFLKFGVDEIAAKKTFKALLGILLVLAGLLSCYYLGEYFIEIDINFWLALLCFVAIILVVVAIVIICAKKLKIPKCFAKIFKPKLFIIIAITLCIVEAFIFNFDYSSQFKTDNSYANTITSDRQYVSTANAGKFLRTEISTNQITDNTSLSNNFMSTSTYNSSTNGYVYEFLKLLGLDYHGTLGMTGLDARASLEALFNVNYFINLNNKSVYGFEKVEGQDALYVNSNTLEFGTFFSNVISLEDFENIPMEERNNLLLEAVVLDETESNYTYTYVFNNLQYEITLKKVTLTNNEIVAKSGAKISVHITGCANQEVYLKLSNFEYDFSTNNQTLKGIVQGLGSKTVKVTAGNYTKTITIYPEGNQMYTDETNYLVNLGYQTTNELNVTISLSAGTYTFDELGFYGYDMNIFQSNVDNLQGTSITLENFETSGTSFSGNITTDSDGYVFLSIPYSTGWSAKIDGEEVDVLKANVGFMALQISEGEHTIELIYNTPLLKSGIAISAASDITFVSLVCIIETKQKKKFIQTKNV